MEWISVEDKLPELDKPVLICYIGLLDNKPHCDAVAVYTENRYVKGKYYWYFTVDGSNAIVKITHWMSLPKMPKV